MCRLSGDEDACHVFHVVRRRARKALLPFPSALQDVLVHCLDSGEDGSEARWRPVLSALQARLEVAHAS